MEFKGENMEGRDILDYIKKNKKGCFTTSELANELNMEGSHLYDFLRVMARPRLDGQKPKLYCITKKLKVKRRDGVYSHIIKILWALSKRELKQRRKKNG